MNLYNTDSRKVIAYRDVYYDDIKVMTKGNYYDIIFYSNYATVLDDGNEEFSFGIDKDGKLESHVFHIDSVFHEDFKVYELRAASMNLVLK